MSQFDSSIFYLLDAIPSRAIKRWIKLHEGMVDYSSEHYSFFAHRRSQMFDQLKNALRSNTKSYGIQGWRRIVDHRFSNTPLSALGSILHFPGGRFNVGDIDKARFPVFAALYLAEDVETAYREMLSLDPNQDNSGLTSQELNAAGNISQFVIEGQLTQVIDLTEAETLREFYEAIKKITIPPYYLQKAKQMKINPMLPVSSMGELMRTFLREDWRLMPMQFDVPANSQILGQIAYEAGIEGVLFPSVKTKKKNLAVYPENFKDSDAYIEVRGDVAASVVGKRIDKDTYKKYI